MFRVTFSVWLMDRCEDDSFYDSHEQHFTMSRQDARTLLRELGFESLHWFLKNYTYDMTAQLYMLAVEREMIIREWIERSAI